jgi:AraC-like DNA-binding protein
MSDQPIKTELNKNDDQLTVSLVYLNLLSNYLEETEQAQILCSNINHISSQDNVQAPQRITLNQLNKLMSAIEKQTGSLAFGLTIGEHIHPSDYGTIGYAFMNCANLKQALGLAASQKAILNQALFTTLIENDECYHYKITTQSHHPYIASLIELDFSSALQLAKFLVGKLKSDQVKLLKVQFKHNQLNNNQDYQRAFNCPIFFGADVNEIVIAKNVLDIPVRSANPDIFKMLQRKIDRLHNIELSDTAFSQKVFCYISLDGTHNIPDIANVAQQFNISVSALKKRLQLKGLNYSAMCDIIKKKKALNMLACPTVKIKEICMRLHFNSPSAFNRAFKRWTNMTPTAYRKQDSINGPSEE